MKIAFVGKGGSGKTTTAALFARHACSQGHRTLALDADINQHLAAALEYHGDIVSMGTNLERIKKYLHGTNSNFDTKDMKKTTPPGRGSQLVTLDSDDWFISRFTKDVTGVRVAGAGDIPEGNVGVRCYHGLNGAIELVLGHMIDADDDAVIVDMTAGADAFSSTLFAKVDAMVLVVEPTLKSLSVYDQFLPNVEKYDIPFYVVANKIVDQTDVDFIAGTIPQLTAVLPQSAYVRARERGQDSEMEKTLIAQLEKLAACVFATKRDWRRMQARSLELHAKNAESWAGIAARSQIDPEFSLECAARSMLRA